ncbi:MAG: hypothetical protein ACI9TO_001029, partial [Rickettsiales bacterium]
MKYLHKIIFLLLTFFMSFDQYFSFVISNILSGV